MRRLTKKLLTTFLALSLLFAAVSVNVYAKAPETANIESTSIQPSLSFSGTTANCSVVARADHVSDSISVTLKLWRGTTLLKTWSNSGNLIVTISDTYTVTSGYIYKLTADVTVNSTVYPTVSVSKYCP